MTFENSIEVFRWRFYNHPPSLKFSTFRFANGCIVLFRFADGDSYESNVGTFEKAVPLGTSFFRESWGELERLVGDADRDAPIMTYCTGGIRCVKVSRSFCLNENPGSLCTMF